MSKAARPTRRRRKQVAASESAGDVFIRLIKQRLSNPNRKNENEHLRDSG